MLILASASPRRRELLLAAGLDHEVRATNVPEIPIKGEEPTAFARRMALEKASAVQVLAADVVVGADTVVCVAGQMFGKPGRNKQARHMLASLSGTRHWVHTGICLRTSERTIVDLASTAVDFVDLSDADLEEYVRSGEGDDKAGAYAIQGLASRYVRSIEGSYHNVVGLPVALVYQHLRTLGFV